ncbi:MAG: hypothetical protein HC872_07395 [Gammaproteobacteria bacterium]|nr:hypothetical protein [Gammaproteobacteria bacterium]
MRRSRECVLEQSRFNSPSLAGDVNRKSREEEAESGRVRLHMVELKKVSGGSRFWAGPFRGNSNITIDVTVLNAEGRELRRQKVNRRGNWFLGSVTVGATDNKMLTNIARDVCSLIPKSAN